MQILSEGMHFKFMLSGSGKIELNKNHHTTTKHDTALVSRNIFRPISPKDFRYCSDQIQNRKYSITGNIIINKSIKIYKINGVIRITMQL